MADHDLTRTLRSADKVVGAASTSMTANIPDVVDLAKSLAVNAASESDSVKFRCVQGNAVMVARAIARDHVLFELDARSGFERAEGRAPLNICVCLDRSGSMEGDPLEYAKSACGFVIDLLEPQDVFSIVTFAETAEVLMPARKVVNRAQIKDYVGGISVGKTANLYDGLALACNQIAVGKTSATLNRVLLLTDGEPTAGSEDVYSIISYAAEQKRNNISISALGFGPDYSEDLIGGIAKRSGGNYYYISRPDLIPEVFRRELDLLMHTSVRNLRLKLHLAHGVAVRQVYGNDLRISQRLAEVDLVDVEYGGRLSSLWELEMTPHPAGIFRIAKAQLTYNEPATGITQTLSCDVVKAFTSDESKVSDGVNPRVQAQVEVANAARKLDRTVRDIRVGRAAPELVVRDMRQAHSLLISHGQLLLAHRVEQAIFDIERGDSVEKTLIGTIMDLDQGRAA